MQLPSLHTLLVCRALTRDPLLNAIEALAARPDDAALRAEAAAQAIEQAEALGIRGSVAALYLTYRLLAGENPAAAAVEKTGGAVGKSLRAALAADLAALRPWLSLQLGALTDFAALDNYEPTQPEPNRLPSVCQALQSAPTAEEAAALLLEQYRAYGCGDLARFRAFRWQSGALCGIRNFDRIELSDLIGYERQKQTLVENTEAFLSGKPANNVLLVGARGTGKSSSVKALANRYFSRGLRLLELAKPQLAQLPQILEALRQYKSKKFILFLDDLSFEPFETEYKHLKSAIEGGVEARPQNVLLYATSNRRHLIKETWQDREGADELHRADSVNETISLSDRFGLTLHYTAPDQTHYLSIIAALLKKSGVELTDEQLRIAGLRWENTHSGRSGRAARQFVDHYLGTIAGGQKAALAQTPDVPSGQKKGQ